MILLHISLLKGRWDTLPQDSFHGGEEGGERGLESRSSINNLAKIDLSGPRPFAMFLRKPVYLNGLKSSKSLVQIEETFKIHLLQKMTRTFYDRGFTCNSIFCNLCYTLGVFVSYRT